MAVQMQEPFSGKFPSVDSLVEGLEKEKSSYVNPYMSNYRIINSKVITHEGPENAEVIAKYTARKRILILLPIIYWFQ